MWHSVRIPCQWPYHSIECQRYVGPSTCRKFHTTTRQASSSAASCYGFARSYADSPHIYSIYTMREPSRSPKLQAGRQWILPYVLLLIWRSVKIMIFHYLFIRLALFPPRIWRSHHAGATPAALASDSEAGGLQDGHLGLPFVVRHGSGLPGR